jgi:tRNA-Thr(GGU) m(6)t(6)A37 methyltransferase TsaA
MTDYDWNQAWTIHPVGFVRSEIKEPSLAADREGLKGRGGEEARRQARQIKNMTATIVVNPALTGILDGLADFSHALVLYWPHLARPESRNLTHVRPMGRPDFHPMGVFASCSPARPNPILATAVQVLGVEGNRLTVQGLEAVDQSPVIDIKPYNRNYLRVEGLKPAEWMERIERELGD